MNLTRRLNLRIQPSPTKHPINRHLKIRRKLIPPTKPLLNPRKPRFQTRHNLPHRLSGRINLSLTAG
jgi:hypothetical protein